MFTRRARPGEYDRSIDVRFEWTFYTTLAELVIANPSAMLSLEAAWQRVAAALEGALGDLSRGRGLRTTENPAHEEPGGICENYNAAVASLLP